MLCHLKDSGVNQSMWRKFDGGSRNKTWGIAERSGSWVTLDTASALPVPSSLTLPFFSLPDCPEVNSLLLTHAPSRCLFLPTDLKTVGLSDYRLTPLKNKSMFFLLFCFSQETDYSSKKVINTSSIFLSWRRKIFLNCFAHFLYLPEIQRFLVSLMRNDT